MYGRYVTNLTDYVDTVIGAAGPRTGGPPPPGHAEWGIAIPTTTYYEGVMVLPLKPIFPGFLVNTAFWGGVAWLVLERRRVRLWLVLRLFGARRAARGLCVACRHPVEGAAACPECGEPVGQSMPSPQASDGGTDEPS